MKGHLRGNDRSDKKRLNKHNRQKRECIVRSSGINGVTIQSLCVDTSYSSVSSRKNPFYEKVNTEGDW